MPGKGERTIIGLAVLISVIALIVAIILAKVNRQPAKQTQTETFEQAQTERYSSQYSKSESPAKVTDEFAQTDIKSGADSKVNPSSSQKGQTSVTMKDIIMAARSWRPAYSQWYGRMAPDFTLADLNGKQHKLSDYRGKNVILVFWATWCGPCRLEIPHLIKLQDTIGQDKLVILSITQENSNLVKSFVTDKKINYTALLDKGNMPEPYSYINSIPCSFFIDTEGKVKLATEGLISSEEIKAILQAE